MEENYVQERYKAFEKAKRKAMRSERLARFAKKLFWTVIKVALILVIAVPIIFLSMLGNGITNGIIDGVSTLGQGHERMRNRRNYW